MHVYMSTNFLQPVKQKLYYKTCAKLKEIIEKGISDIHTFMRNQVIFDQA